MAGALSVGWARGAQRTVAGAACAPAGGECGDRRALLGGAQGASQLGAGQGAGLARAGRSRDAMAGGEHDRGVVRPRRIDGQTQAAPALSAIERPICRVRRCQCGMVHRLQGLVLTGDGTHCEPLTLSDAYSRYLLRCQPLGRTDSEHVWPVLDIAFLEFGLPLRLRSDNGPPFASTGAGGLSRLAVKVIKAGVRPERIAPGKPQQNGRLERLHLTLLRDTADPPARSLREQLGRFRDFQRLYNEERPHAALGNTTPAEHYRRSPRRWDGILREPEYPAEAVLRRVHRNGAMRWRGAEIYLSEALIGEPVGLIERPEGGSWAVHYGPITLGVIDHRGDRLRKLKKACGFVDNPDELPTTPQAQQPQQQS